MKNKTKEKMELAPKTPETVNPFQMMRRFAKDMEQLFQDFGGFEFPKFFQTDFPPFRAELDGGLGGAPGLRPEFCDVSTVSTKIDAPRG